MNQVKITASLPINPQSKFKKHKLYRVFLGATNTVDFVNKQDAENYASMVTGHVNDFIRIANKAYSELFTNYRTIWPMLDKKSNKVYSEYCNVLNHRFEVLFECEQSSIFTNCYSIYTTLIAFCKALEETLKKKKMYLQLYLCNAIAAMLNSNSMGIKIIKSHIIEK